MTIVAAHCNSAACQCFDRPREAHSPGRRANWQSVESYPGELDSLRAENTRLRRLLDLTEQQARAVDPDQTGAATSVDMRSSPEQKIVFYLDMFRCRSDLYAVRWENPRDGRSGWVPAIRGRWRKGMSAAAAGG
jgi:hypothetical protein